jgi:predicted phosphodiesterase
MSVKGDIVKKELTRFPTTPILTLAKKIYKDNPKVFTNVADVRGTLNYHTGKSGVKNRKKVIDRSHIQIVTNDTNPFKLPESFEESFEPYIISQSKTLIISDLHFPYQNNQAITAAIKYGLKEKVTCILINGDLLDFASISRHEKDWRQRSVYEEFESVRDFLRMLRKTFPKAKIIFKEGNHDERWEKWLYVKAPELFDDPEYKLEVRLRLGELKIDIVKDRRPVKIGKLTVLHGHEMAGTSGGVNPARSTFTKTLESVLIGHFHKSSSHSESSMWGDLKVTESVGCLCGLHPQFMRVNKWNFGFAIVDLNIKTGEYLVGNKKIINGKVY